MNQTKLQYLKQGTCVAAIAFACSTSAWAEQQAWTLTSNSQVGFDIKSMGVTVVDAQFKQLQSNLKFDIKNPQAATASTNFVLDVNSLTFSKPSLKNKILGEDLFYASKYKTVSFNSRSIKQTAPDKYAVTGDLTVRGVTKPVTFNSHIVQNKQNPQRLDFKADVVIDRSDFGMKKAIGGIGQKVNIKLSGQWQPAA